ncbi:hypothetical protein PanWU01x14_242510 [Parasponia andersonii]|uniref:Transmembrane protein n=1 Tax=Parasponia andersonii TaxID=3476 RepID=A0A2P5BG42_PARAD|nr:hypothetical protein PanWU01x14_242510 [Parasponia andersonii]
MAQLHLFGSKGGALALAVLVWWCKLVVGLRYNFWFLHLYFFTLCHYPQKMFKEGKHKGEY